MKERSEKDKKTAQRFSGFMKYREDKMTESERNAFERELQTDPFAEEAMEGFESITANEARHDINLLRKRLGASKSSGRRYLYYSAAASVAMIAVLSTVIFLITREKPSMVLSENDTVKEIIEIARPGTITRSISAGTGTTPDPAGRKEAQIIAENAAPVTSEPVSANVKEMQTISADNDMLRDSPALKKAYVDTGIAKDERKFTSIAIRSKADAEFVALHDTSALAMDEVVFVDYGKSLRGGDTATTPEGYLPPEPVPGRTEFNKYLEENIKRPGGETEGQRVVVVAGFTVDRNGSVDSIRIIRSPSDSYSEEAIRLIKEGPRWKPAMENGKRIDEEVRIRIVFR